MKYTQISAEAFNIDDLIFLHSIVSEPSNAPEGKIAVGLSSQNTVDLFEGLRPFSPSKREFECFMSTFSKHKIVYDYIRSKDEGREKIIEKIFLIAQVLRPDLRNYFLTKIRAQIANMFRHNLEQGLIFEAKFDKKMKEQEVPETNPDLQIISSGIRLSQGKSTSKTNLLRVLDALWELRFFTNETGEGSVTRGELMEAIGQLLNEDLSNFESILSQSYNNTKTETNLAIFDEMKAKIQQKCIPK